MKLETISQSIKDSSWVLRELLPIFRIALESQDGSQNSQDPTCILASRRYKGIDLRSTWLQPRRGIGRIKFIDGPNDPMAPCIEAIVPLNAKLAPSSDSRRTQYQDAVELIEQVDSNSWHELFGGIDFIATVASTSFRSCSSPHAFGCLVFTTSAAEQAVGDLATSFVHELAHQELFLINLMDRLIVAGCENITLFAPYQQRERPPIGRLHSLAALSRMISFRRRARLDISWLERTMDETYASLNDDVLTPFARELRNSYLEGAHA